jgi:hypothetical protein
MSSRIGRHAAAATIPEANAYFSASNILILPKEVPGLRKDLSAVLALLFLSPDHVRMLLNVRVKCCVMARPVTCQLGWPVGVPAAYTHIANPTALPADAGIPGGVVTPVLIGSTVRDEGQTSSD